MWYDLILVVDVYKCNSFSEEFLCHIPKSVLVGYIDVLHGRLQWLMSVIKVEFAPFSVGFFLTDNKSGVWLCELAIRVIPALDPLIFWQRISLLL